jgi:hypothetical protein
MRKVIQQFLNVEPCLDIDGRDAGHDTLLIPLRGVQAISFAYCNAVYRFSWKSISLCYTSGELAIRPLPTRLWSLFSGWMHQIFNAAARVLSTLRPAG